MKKDKYMANYILRNYKNEVGYTKQSLAESWAKLYKDMIKECDLELNLSNPSIDYKSVATNTFVARFAIRKLQKLNVPEFMPIVESHFQGIKVSNIFKSMLIDEKILKLGLQVYIDFGLYEYKKSDKALLDLLDENFPEEHSKLKILYKSSYTNSLYYTRLALEKISKEEYGKLSVWESRAVTNATEKVLNLNDCFVNLYFDKSGKAKINKKTGLRKPDGMSFVMPM